MLGPLRLAEFGEETREIERLAAERERAILPRPLVRAAVPGQLDAVEVGVVQVDRLVGTVVRSAIDAPAPVQQPCERDGQIPAGGVVDREVVETSRAGGRRRAALALPGVEADMVVVAAG